MGFNKNALHDEIFIFDNNVKYKFDGIKKAWVKTDLEQFEIVQVLPDATVEILGLSKYLLNQGLFICVTSVANPENSDCTWAQIQ